LNFSPTKVKMGKTFVSKYVLIDGNSAYVCADALTICKMVGISRYEFNKRLADNPVMITDGGLVYTDVRVVQSKRGGKYEKRQSGFGQ